MIEQRTSSVIQPVYVTETKPRESDWPERKIMLPFKPVPESFNSASLDWREEDDWLVDFTVHVDNAPQARVLAAAIWQAHEAGDGSTVQALLDQIKSFGVIPYEQRSDQAKWAHMLTQMPGDIGGPNKDKIAEILSARCQGKILEAMCGFNSYLLPSTEKQVVALDWCREALEKYRYPERTRIIFDINNITTKRGMDFFNDGEFNAVTICFGYNYLSHPVWVFREFHRLLAKGGRLDLVENPHQGYGSLSKRWFSPDRCRYFLEKALFNDIKIFELPVAEDWEVKNGGCYYLTEAVRD